MKMVLKGRARPRWKKEVKMKMFKAGVKLVMFLVLSFLFCCFSMSCVPCRVVSCP